MAENRQRFKHNSIGMIIMQSSKPVRNPRKQRKRMFNAPAHLRHKLMAAPLSPELLASKGVKTLPVRKGDTVRVIRGDHSGFEGKINRIDLKNYRVYLEGLTREKVDGTTVFIGLHPSKVMIRNLNLDDKLRKAILERKKSIVNKKEKPENKAEKKVEKAKPAEKKETVPEEKSEKPTAKKPKTASKKKPSKKKEDKPKTAKTRKPNSKTEGGS
jgi:large subunit ribosomal protein L24